ncbi:MAG: 2-oxoacid:acceptor oxidoreductase subunit alpha [Bdellovibrionales bacterium]|nr:2-oxoacid:acceptor oxidoreductase subunit alpha [Bdellovibrionales bacterium]
MDKIVNDFSIRVATVNGTGSQSSNNILFKTLFRMGIGACGKNMFPSNIQGLPTWFQIRVSPEGYQALRENDDIAILMNAQTAHEDIDSMRPGTTILYNSDVIKFEDKEIKDGMNMYALPVETLSRKISNPKLMRLLKNLFYVGAVAVLYGLDLETLEGVIRDTFKSKQKAIDANLEALHIGIDYAKENFEKKDSYWFEKANCSENKIVMEGNSAAALGALYGGCTVLAWYPITPSSSLAEALIAYAKKYRVDENGKMKFADIQAEDELASAGMVLGAGWAGARSMTTTSGPGISLMSEFIGLAYYAEIPSVFIDVQRVGPSTGLPTRTQQCDIMLCATASHGDTKHILLLPSNIQECVDLTAESFNLAERFQTPIFVITDLDLGMNNWVADDIQYKAPKYDRGKVLTKEDLEKNSDWGRYLDKDGDGVCYRTLPGTDHPKAAYFTRGSGHDEYARYTESPHAYIRNVDRLNKKYQTARKAVPKPILRGEASAKLGIIAYGTTDHAMQETLDRLQDKNVKYLRLLAYPFGQEVHDFVKSCDRVVVVEQNRDAQMRQLLELDIRGQQDKMHSILYYGGFSISPDFIERELKEKFLN